jgi:predicted permease
MKQHPSVVSRLHSLVSRLLSLASSFKRKRSQRDFAEELQAHLALEADRLREAGMREKDALDAARRNLGNMTRIQERHYEAHRWLWLDHLIQDLRFGLRQLRRNPGFTAVAIITLALGIGANGAIFSVVNAVLLRPLPYRDPGRLMLVSTGNFSKGWTATSPPDFRALRERNHSFESLSAYYDSPFTLTGEQEAEQVSGAIVSSEFFSTLGVRPLLGRAFLASEEQWGSNHVVIVSEPFWRSHLGANRKISGKTLRLNGEQYTVIGVMPASFHFFGEKQIWVPMAWAPGDAMNTHENCFLSMVGRLKPGVHRAQAFADLNSIMVGIAERHPENRGITASLEPLRGALVNGVRPALLILLSAVGFLLLIACMNIAHLFLARAAGRQKEIAIRSALGAGRRRLMRQFMTESVLLALGGGAAGLAVAYLSLHVVPLAGESLPRIQEVRVDGWVIAFTFVISMLTGVLFGLAPALGGSASNLNATLKEGGRTSATGGGKFRSGLVIGEVVLSLVLLVGAALMIQSFERLLRVNAGFDPSHVLTFEIDMPQSVEAGVSPLENGAPQRMLAFFRQLLSGVEALPGVKAAGVTSDLPLQGENWTKYISFADRPAPLSLNQVAQVQYRSVNGHYFRTMGIALLKGRLFKQADGKRDPLVAIVSEALARRFWPNQDPVGKVIWMAPPENLLPPGSIPKGYHIPRETVVGVVGDVRYGALDKGGLPVVYQPMTQSDFMLGNFVAVRTRSDPRAMVPSIRKALFDINKDQPMANIATMQEIWSDSVNEPRLESLLLGLFGGLGLALAAVGVYGVISYSIAQRTHEIGIRMALGARKRHVLQLVVGEGMIPALVGVAVGLIGALGLTRFLSSLLYGVKPTDPLTFLAVSLILAGVALLACYIPARRATKVDPMVALRQE